MRILLSAYACEPDKGSEPGVGWHWAIELAKIGHEVWVITRANNRPSIEKALQTDPIKNLHFRYYDLPAWARWWKKGTRGVHLYYLLWQWGAFRLARSFTGQVSFDYVHHITFGVFREPSFMAFLGKPFIFGPVGGGERAPYALRKSFPRRGLVLDALRDLLNGLTRINPLMRAVYRRSSIILCKTKETLSCIPPKYRNKCVLRLEIGFDGPVAGRSPATGGLVRQEKKLRFLFVGRLIYWKGLHLGLRAFAQLLQEYPDVELTIIGSGPDEARFRRLSGSLGTESAIKWIPWMDQSAVMQAYEDHDIFLFPSLHDSSGNVVLEALAHGLPVICLDLGGPGVLVDERCGLTIATAGKGEQDVILALAAAMRKLFENQGLRASLAAGTRACAEEHTWGKLVTDVCGDISHDTASSRPAHSAQPGRIFTDA